MKIIDTKTLALFRGAGICEWCKRLVVSRSPHHIFSRGAGRLDIPINLISLCNVFSGGEDCHVRAHTGHILRCDLLAVVAAREKTTQDEIERQIFLLLRTPKENP